MPLVAAKCTNCGGELQIDSGKDAAVCPYCGAAFIVEKAINYYTTQNDIHIGNIAHADIHVNDNSGLEARLANAEAFLTRHKEYERAEELFLEITDDFSGDYRGWWGVARAMTREFSGLDISVNCRIETEEELDAVFARSLEDVRFYTERAFNVMGSEDRVKLQPVWEDFKSRCHQHQKELVASAAAKSDEFNREYARAAHEKEQMMERLAQQKKKTAKLAKKYDKAYAVLYRTNGLGTTSLVFAVLGMVLTGLGAQSSAYEWLIGIGASLLLTGIMCGLCRIGNKRRYKKQGKLFHAESDKLQKLQWEYDEKYRKFDDGLSINLIESGFCSF